MSEVPKIVYDCLRAGSPERTWSDKGASGQVHPDADLLTAFAEQALPVSERDGVLQHLALCGDCRELVALALPLAEAMAAPIAADAEARATPIQAKDKRRWLTPKLVWPSLRWAALAAVVLVAGSVLLTRPGKLSSPAMQPSGMARVSTTEPPASGSERQSSESPAVSQAPSPRQQSPVFAETSEAKSVQAKKDEARATEWMASSANQMAATTVPSPQIKSSSVASSAEPSPALGKANGVRGKSELQASRKPLTGDAAMASLPVKSEILIADNKITDNKKDSTLADKPLPEGARAFAYDASAGIGATEAQASGANVAEAGGSLMALNDASAVVKAKEPPQEIAAFGQAKTGTANAAGSVTLQGGNVFSAASLAPAASRTLANTLANNVTWAIKAGVLQRSLDSGQSWQSALHANHPLLCYTSHGAEVWTGGQAGTLFHSVDSGATWLQVQPSIKAQLLSSDVTHIDVRDPAEIVVSTSNNEIWNSADGGKSWEKK